MQSSDVRIIRRTLNSCKVVSLKRAAQTRINSITSYIRSQKNRLYGLRFSWYRI